MEAKFTFKSVRVMCGSKQIGIKFACFIESASTDKDNRELKFNLNGQNPEAVELIQIESSSISLFPLNLSKTFPNLVALSLYQCGLTEISRSDLVGLEGLVELHLSSNKLTSLPRDLLTDMKKLKFLDFSGNRIAILDARMFDGIKNQLEFLYFSGNGLINDKYKRGEKQTIDEFLKAVAVKSFKPEIYESKSFPQNLSERFKDLWLTRKLSDFTIVVDGKEFKVHKVVLAIQSKYFSAMFEENQGRKSTSCRMKISNFTAEAFGDFLRFLYTGKIGNRDNAMELFSLATVYEVADLKSMAETIIWNKVDESNAMEVLILAKKHRSEELMTRSFAAMKRAHPEIGFDESLMKAQDVENLIRAKKEYEKTVENARKTFEKATLKKN